MAWGPTERWVNRGTLNEARSSLGQSAVGSLNASIRKGETGIVETGGQLDTMDIKEILGRHGTKLEIVRDEEVA